MFEKCKTACFVKNDNQPHHLLLYVHQDAKKQVADFSAVKTIDIHCLNTAKTCDLEDFAIMPIAFAKVGSNG